MPRLRVTGLEEKSNWHSMASKDSSHLAGIIAEKLNAHKGASIEEELALRQFVELAVEMLNLKALVESQEE